jgi:hypothetical protein
MTEYPKSPSPKELHTQALARLEELTQAYREANSAYKSDDESDWDRHCALGRAVREAGDALWHQQKTVEIFAEGIKKLERSWANATPRQRRLRYAD